MNQKSSRRRFLKAALGGFGGMLTAQVAGLFPEAQISLAQQNNYEIASPNLPIPASGVGELYGGFLLLPEGAPIPPYVQDYIFGIPTMCNVGTSEKPGSGAIHRALINSDSLSQLGRFPVYELALDRLPPQIADIRFRDTSLITHTSGEIFGGWVNYNTHDSTTGLDFTSVTIMAQVDHPRPFPLWSNEPVEDGGRALILEKVDYVPGGAGIKIESLSGFTLHWIHQDIYYALTTQHLPGIEAQTLTSALRLIEVATN